jgi:signal peptidase II
MNETMQEINYFSRKLRIAIIAVVAVLIIDQSLKIWIKTHMHLGEEIHVAGNWFILHFTENNGMAFGMELSGEFGKLFLSIFRIVAAAAIGYYAYTLIRKNAGTPMIVFISLIFAGAVGNILDSIFYGMIFTESDFRIAELFPPQGYAGFLHGKVVDMFYFPILEGHFPSWFPLWANEEFIFFRPVFNIADSAITTGVICIILFQSHFFQEEKSKPEVTATDAGMNDPSVNKAEA